MQSSCASLFASLLLCAVLRAQSPTVTLTSATLTIDPQSGDSYTMQGAFDGLALSSAQVVQLSVGQFAASLLITDFVQQQGTNVYVYQDSTGQAPYWLSSLTLDLDAQTFSAQATGIVLAGLTNPFAMQLGTESTSACTMARVQSSDGVNFQLTAGDGVNEPCGISFPQISPPSFFIGQPTDIQFQVTIPLAAKVDPGSVQLFQIDGNGQPAGAPACVFSDTKTATSEGEIYQCTVHFSQDTPGSISLMVQATAGANTLLSPGFRLLAVAPMTQADVDAVYAVSSAAGDAWEQNFATYGDTPQARIQTISSLVGLDGVQEVRLLEDGLSIGVQFTSGVQFSLFLNRIGDAADPTANATTLLPSLVSQPANQALTPKASDATCSEPRRPVVKDNGVLIWDSGLFSKPNVTSIAMDKFGPDNVKCPKFDIHHVSATINNAQLFKGFGTVIIDTHGQPWYDEIKLLTSEPVGPHVPAEDPKWKTSQAGGLTTGTAPGDKTLLWGITTEFIRHLGPFQRTLVFNGACYGARNSSIADVMAADGGAYFGFTHESFAPNAGKIPIVSLLPGFAVVVEPTLLDDLLSKYMTVANAYNDVPHSDPSVLAVLASGLPKNLNMQQLNSRFVLLNDPNNKLAYLGNPAILGSLGGGSPYTVTAPATVSFTAQLDGAMGCDGTMNYAWKSSMDQGHLIAANGTDKDSFTSMSKMAKYMANSNAMGGTDNLMVDFLPDGSTPIPALACATVNVKSPYFAVVGNEPMGVPISVSGGPGNMGHWTLNLAIAPGAKDSAGGAVSGSLAVEFDNSLPTPGFYTSDSNMHVVSAKASATYQGKDYGMSCPPFTFDPPNKMTCNFRVRLTKLDMSDPTAPQGEASATVLGPNNSNASLNFFFTPN